MTKNDLLKNNFEIIKNNEFDNFNSIHISPLYGSAKSFAIKELFAQNNLLVLLLTETKLVNEFKVELSILGLSDDLIVIDDFNIESIQEKLTEISKRKKFILISTYQILTLKLPDKEKINHLTTKVSVGGEVKYDDLIEYLNLLVYTKDKFVEAQGYYSQRGAIIDFWSYSEKSPARLEFDGDFIDSIRYFDPESQRSFEKIEEVTLAAAFENQTVAYNSDIFSYLDNPIFIASSYELNNLKVINDENLTSEENKNFDSQINTKDTDDEDDFPEITADLITENSDDQQKNDVQSVQSFNYKNTNAKWIIEEEINSEFRVDIGISPSPSINSNYQILFSTIKDFSDKNYDVFITSENELQTNRLKDLLAEISPELDELIESQKIKVETLAIKEGFINRNEKLLVLTDYQIFNKPYRTKISSSKKFKKSKAKSFASIKRGDYVVHEDYGIGQYSGLETIKIGDANQESMKILYAEGGIVYVNLNYLALVKRYSSNENLKPTLATLGSGEWQNTKAKTKKKIKEAARDLIELYAKRKSAEGFRFSPDTIWQKELEASFFYEDTPDQAKASEDVKNDMEAQNPMDRLVCGDVGFGKTEVAVRAAFKAVQDGKQACVLVPTTILAEQHYNTFKDRLSQYPVRVAALSRFQTKKEQKEILKNLEQGQLDILIGTHRLLSKDVKFKDLGLLIIDEEHRFGVSAKEKLRQIKVNIDTLALTATPIPRTLNLSLLGARDLSIIATPPPNRQPIYTSVSTFDAVKIREWIINELKRNGQVYFVHDRVHSIDKLADYIRRYVPEAKIAVAHGQMKPAKLEEVIHGFLNRKFDVLLSTKIIESGIDIPNVNTIIINRADRFGLAELHQLRGRVGRSDRQAYAFFLVPSLSGISKVALRRLQAIEEYTEIGSGFNVAMRDLEIRGAGNLLGTEQTGFINEVGFDLYVKLINEAVEELKYQDFKEVFKSLPKIEERTDPTIDTYFDIGIPVTYMPEQMDRLNFYTALYSVKSLSEIEELREEMLDRFSAIPEIVKRLVLTATLKFYASYALFERIAIQRKVIHIILPRGEKEDYYKVRFVELMRFIMDDSAYKDKIKFSQQKEVMKLVVENRFEKPEDILTYLITFCSKVSKLFGNEVKLKADVEEAA
ncbi:MAG TPA: transcription-repair coupling factor [Ignavibacteriaceae bacterium]|jgi:transcription-repair coupling factor (superfamily II helicase)|nr:MAG: Transcription-repair-coupling factor [Ignavibacteria bacterium ADurb.Bin266]OQY70520.1 MAG: transcription-repair coupling factor [Ignavibacteriales bacterium UTCHB2]HQF42658.1 transcription-repair coupling factor [Ignavibacteriaceae bacterium]HQI40728.1 transcription-repair coupling factor [Ignavibacteriaceae bacterium]HQJ45034.1 transcription-repair coupling factor [Ignavibacteriaceae bacterium]